MLSITQNCSPPCGSGWRPDRVPGRRNAMLLPSELMHQAAAIGTELTSMLVGNRAYLQASTRAIPEAFRMPDETPHPHFMTADFGLARSATGQLELRLVELQAFPSVFAYQTVLPRPIERSSIWTNRWTASWAATPKPASGSSIPRWCWAGMIPRTSFSAEVDPLHQKTLPDFLITAEKPGHRDRRTSPNWCESRSRAGRRNCSAAMAAVSSRCTAFTTVLSSTRSCGAKFSLPFDYREPLDVEWAGHPNWYFHISKFSIPYLDHPAVPPAVFLSDWMNGVGRDRLPPTAKRLS